VFELYGRAHAVHNPREYQHVDLRGPGAQQGAGAGVGGGAGSQDVVDKNDAAALDIGGSFGDDLECALHIAGALGARQSDLLFGRPHPPKRLRGQFDPTLT
jgi:hypothetical protein